MRQFFLLSNNLPNSSTTNESFPPSSNQPIRLLMGLILFHVRSNVVWAIMAKIGVLARIMIIFRSPISSLWIGARETLSIGLFSSMGVFMGQKSFLSCLFPTGSVDVVVRSLAIDWRADDRRVERSNDPPPTGSRTWAEQRPCASWILIATRSGFPRRIHKSSIRMHCGRGIAPSGGIFAH